MLYAAPLRVLCSAPRPLKLLDGEGGKPTHTNGLSFAEDDPEPDPDPRSLRRTEVEC